MNPLFFTLFLALLMVVTLVFALCANGVVTPSIITTDDTDVLPIVPVESPVIKERELITQPITHDCIVYEQHGDSFVVIHNEAYPLYVDNRNYIEGVLIINPDAITQTRDRTCTGDVVKVQIVGDTAILVDIYQSIYDTNFYDLNACSKARSINDTPIILRRRIRYEAIINGVQTYTAGIGRNRIEVFGRGLQNDVIYEMWLIEKGSKTVGLVTHGTSKA